MFEHLVSPQHKDFMTKRSRPFKLYASFLLLALFIFTSTWLSVNQGPKSSAQSSVELGIMDRVKIFATNETGETQFVLRSPNISVFSFVLDNPYENLLLKRLNFSIDGVIDEQFLNNLVLYQDQVQINAKVELINKELVFILEDYPLAAGQNYFHLGLNGLADGLLGQKTKLFLRDIDSIDLAYQGKKVLPLGSFPISSSDVLILDQAKILSYNNLSEINFIAPADVYTKLADFSLSTQGETVDLKTIKLFLHNNEQLTDFYLASRGQILTRISAISELNFSLPSGVLIKADEDLPLELWATMGVGAYEINFDFASAKGFVSGKQVDLTTDFSLAKAKVIPSVLTVKSESQRKNLTASWNTVAELQLSNVGKQTIYLHKLAWEISAQDSQVETLELWSHDKLLASSQLVDGKVVFTFWGDESLELSQDLSLQLIAKVKILGDEPRLMANFLTDDQNMQEENGDNYLLWSVADQLYNSYLLPGLPLTPVILE